MEREQEGAKSPFGRWELGNKNKNKRKVGKGGRKDGYLCKTRFLIRKNRTGDRDCGNLINYLCFSHKSIVAWFDAQNLYHLPSSRHNS